MAATALAGTPVKRKEDSGLITGPGTYVVVIVDVPRALGIEHLDMPLTPERI